MEQFLFFFIAFIVVASAVYFVIAKNPLYAILSLVISFIGIGFIYIILNSQFLFAVQVIVYTGAIMVLFLYVLMMLNLNAKDESKKHNVNMLLGVISACILFVGMIGAYKGIAQTNAIANIDSSVGLTKNLGKLLFNEYVLPFELASILILAGIVGSVLIGKKDL